MEERDRMQGTKEVLRNMLSIANNRRLCKDNKRTCMSEYQSQRENQHLKQYDLNFILQIPLLKEEKLPE